MKQSRRMILILLLVAIFVVLGVWLSFVRSNVVVAPVNVNQHASTSGDSEQPVSVAEPSQPDTTATASKSAVVLGQGMTEHPDGHQPEEFIQGRLQLNVPIAFYGRVIDQSDEPVVGANIELQIQQIVRTRSDMTVNVGEPETPITDNDGRFELIGKKGLMVAIDTIKKEGYQLSENAKRHFPYNSETPAPDPGSPAVFRMWKKQGADRLEVGDEIYGLVPNGRQNTLNFLAHTKTEGVQPEGDLIVSVQRPEHVAPKEKYDWSCTFQVTGGGLVESSDEFFNLAPETGYQPRIEVHMDADEPNWAPNVKKKFYLQSRGGSLYGHLEIELVAQYRDKSALWIKYFVNPTGSRNLEYDPRQFTSSQ